jgi:hypothetical protein
MTDKRRSSSAANCRSWEAAVDPGSSVVLVCGCRLILSPFCCWNSPTSWGSSQRSALLRHRRCRSRHWRFLRPSASLPTHALGVRSSHATACKRSRLRRRGPGPRLLPLVLVPRQIAVSGPCYVGDLEQDPQGRQHVNRNQLRGEGDNVVEASHRAALLPNDKSSPLQLEVTFATFSLVAGTRLSLSSTNPMLKRRPLCRIFPTFR